jgi:putative nucleotidyltransferase with HDIG domain
VPALPRCEDIDLDMRIRRADALMAVLARASRRGYIGEPVSQLEHALQCARIAHEQGADDLCVAAALLHDIGHLIEKSDAMPDDLGTREHERVGARYLLGLGMNAAVAELVAGHVNAKRYLVGRDSAYAASLSEASRRTLVFQGGAMAEAEAHAFEQSWAFGRLLKLRQWDDAAKVRGRKVPSLAHYAPLLDALLSYAELSA